ncbi:MAG: hypothetical protein O7D91_21525 [Planctomycetota bacterium]|nr:hypothetical protein [Planctomycetota bacterium]
MNTILSEPECRTIVDKINALTAAVERAIEVLESPWSDMRYHTARDLRELLDRQSSGNPGQLSDPVTARHDVNWGACPTCGCTDLAFTGFPHGMSKDVLCASCDWSGVFEDNLIREWRLVCHQESELEPPHESER